MFNENVDEINSNEELLKKKVQTYFINNIPIHVQYKKGFWKNGYITENNADFFMLNEFLEGSMPIFYAEVSSIDKYIREVKNG